MNEMIELSLKVSTRDEAQASLLAERLARQMVGYSAEPGVTAWVDMDRFPAHCAHDHDEVES